LIQVFFKLCYRHFLRLLPFTEIQRNDRQGRSAEPLLQNRLAIPIRFQCSSPHPLRSKSFPFTTVLQQYCAKARREKRKTEQVIVFENVRLPSELGNRYHFLHFLFTDSWISVVCVNISVRFIWKPFLFSTAFLWYYLNIAKSNSLLLQSCLIDHNDSTCW
jgi:hypothetical protein